MLTEKLKTLTKITVILLFGISEAFPQGDLLIFPKRVVFEDNRGSRDLTLANTGKDTAQYQLTLVNYRMLEDGKFEIINEPDPGQQFADNNLRIFPRTVTLGPNEAQKVKIQVFRGQQLEPGEYRSHLYFRAVPKQKELEKPTVDENAGGIATKLEMVFGISIPVIIEISPASVKTALTDLSLEQQAESQALRFTIQREGNKSAYGDFKVTHTSPSGKTTEVGTTKGVAVYSPIPKRYFSIKLRKTDGVEYTSGKLTLSYNSQNGKGPKFAEEELLLN